jgi:DNA-directed RNA polymerase specialized sigma24 family protein
MIWFLYIPAFGGVTERVGGKDYNSGNLPLAEQRLPVAPRPHRNYSFLNVRNIKKDRKIRREWPQKPSTACDPTKRVNPTPMLGSYMAQVRKPSIGPTVCPVCGAPIKKTLVTGGKIYRRCSNNRCSARAKKIHVDAWTKIQGLLMAVAYNQCDGHRQDAEDAVQTVAARFFSKPRLPITNPTGYFISAVKYEAMAISIRRAKFNDRNANGEYSHYDIEISEETVGPYGRLAEIKLHEAVEALPIKLKRVITERFFREKECRDLVKSCPEFQVGWKPRGTRVGRFHGEETGTEICDTSLVSKTTTRGLVMLAGMVDRFYPSQDTSAQKEYYHFREEYV